MAAWWRKGSLRSELYQQYLKLCKAAGHVLSLEEARQQGFEVNDLMFYYGNFEALKRDVEWELRKDAKELKIIRHPPADYHGLAPLPNAPRTVEEIRRERTEERERQFRQLLQLDKEAENMDVTRAEVMQYLSGLIKKYPEPTQAQARAYSQSTQNKIFPKTTIKTLGAGSWEEVIEIFRANRATSSKAQKSAEKMPTKHRSKEPTGKKRKGRKETYTKEELLNILREAYQELNGHVTQGSLQELRKKHPVPAWQTFAKAFGPRSGWDALVGWGQNPPTRRGRKPKMQQNKNVEATPVKESKVPVAIPAMVGTKMELKITVPGLPAPIMMEFSIK